MPASKISNHTKIRLSSPIAKINHSFPRVLKPILIKACIYMTNNN